MNWYRIAKDLSKIAQIWKYTPERDDWIDEESNERTFSSKIKEMYELEYKYSMLKNNPFTGNPTRKENIIAQIEKNLVEVSMQVREQVLATFEKWLDTHALLSPRTWAEKRTEVTDDEYGGFDAYGRFSNLFYEYSRYAQNQETNYDKVLAEMLNNAVKGDLSQYPYLKSFIDNWLMEAYIEDKKNMAYNELETFNDIHMTEFENVDDAVQWVDDNISLESVGIVDVLDNVAGGDVDSFIKYVDEYGQSEQILIELYQNQVFPAWFDYWSNQGIEDTRGTVQTIHDNMLNASSSDVGNMVATVNMGLNAAHQTGDMVEYLENDAGDSNIRDVLRDCSEGVFIDKANKELRMVGVKI